MLIIVSFIITLCVLVTVHEYGHYLCARIFKVKVLVFSIGFGPRLFNFRSKNSNWCISAIPLGGYVRFLDETTGVVSPSERHLAFNNKPYYQRILIALAGPLSNILFALIIYYISALMGVKQYLPVIQSIDYKSYSISKTQLTIPSKIITIDSHLISSWSEAEQLLQKAISSTKYTIIQLADAHGVKKIVLDNIVLKKSFGDKIFLEDMGLYPVIFEPIISYIQPRSVADVAAFRVGDKIVAINAQVFTNWFDIAAKIHTSAGVKLFFTIKRDNKEIQIVATPQVRTLINNRYQGKLGIMPSINQDALRKNTFVQQYDLIQALFIALNKCYSVLLLNATSLYHMITGQISLSNLGGPISIAKESAVAMQFGVKIFIEFLALISIGLAFINLLPLPMLDGGHILIYMIEMVFRIHISSDIQAIILKVGLVLILGLSLFAIYNDILRL